MLFCDVITTSSDLLTVIRNEEIPVAENGYILVRRTFISAFITFYCNMQMRLKSPREEPSRTLSILDSGGKKIPNVHLIENLYLSFLPSLPSFLQFRLSCYTESTPLWQTMNLLFSNPFLPARMAPFCISSTSASPDVSGSKTDNASSNLKVLLLEEDSKSTPRLSEVAIPSTNTAN